MDRELVELSREQIELIYNERMKKDFPPNELKPLQMIYKAMEAGLYVCYGLAEEREILGYVFLVRLKDTTDYLIDYLAIREDMRGQGIGTLILKKLYSMFRKSDSIIGEVENPDLAQSEEERVLQTRRYDFYMRNGFVDSKVTVTCFGVPFRLIEMTDKAPLEQDAIRQLYKEHYKALLPREMYEKNIIV